MDIYTQIHSDHEEAKKIIEQIMAAGSHNSRRSLFEKLKQAVMTHNDAEADSFYVALEAHTATRAIASRSRKEHIEVNSIFKALSDISMSPSQWESKFADLRNALILHISEEEGDVFTAARKVISPRIAIELAVAMQQLKQMRQQMLRQAS